jgi:hypothetical protein
MTPLPRVRQVSRKCRHVTKTDRVAILDQHVGLELETALNAFDGALIVISHDQAFLRAIGIQREIVL